MTSKNGALTLTLGKLLLRGRKELGMTQVDVCPLASVSHPTIGKWEKGERLAPLAYAIRLAWDAPSIQKLLLVMLDPSGRMLRMDEQEVILLRCQLGAALHRQDALERDLSAMTEADVSEEVARMYEDIAERIRRLGPFFRRIDEMPDNDRFKQLVHRMWDARKQG